jgi:hypothetical protein
VPPAAVEEINEDWSVSLAGMPPKTFRAGDVLSMLRDGGVVPGPPEGEQIVSLSEDRLPGTILSLRGDRLRISAELDSRTKTQQEITLPLTSLSLLWLVAPSESAPAGAALRRIRLERRRLDTVILRNGDMVEGTLSAMDEKTVELALAKTGTSRLERSSVACIVLSTELGRRSRPKRTYGRLVLSNGTRLTLLSARSDGQALNAKTQFGVTVQVSVEQIAALYILGGPAVYLSDLKPARYEHTPYLDVSWPYCLNTSVSGEPIRLGGSVYEKGIGMHSESRLTFDLRPGYKWFEAYVGLDDRSGNAGSVAIEVLLDGKPQAAGTEELTAMNARALRISTVGGRELTLVVRFGRHGDVGDHVDWADARLVK